MTLFLDSSGLVARHIDFPGRAVVLDACAAEPDWCASVLALTESLVLAERLSDDTTERDALRRALRTDWERLAVVPVDRPASTVPPSWRPTIRSGSSMPSTWPPPTVCPGPSSTPRSTTTRSPWPWPSGSTWCRPEPARGRLEP